MPASSSLRWICARTATVVPLVTASSIYGCELRSRRSTGGRWKFNAIVLVPRRTRPSQPSRRRRTSAMTASVSSAMRCACAMRSRPAAVGNVFLPSRSSSDTPKRASSSRICVDTAGCDRLSRRAAAEKLCVSATACKVSSWSRFRLRIHPTFLSSNGSSCFWMIAIETINLLDQVSSAMCAPNGRHRPGVGSAHPSLQDDCREHGSQDPDSHAGGSRRVARPAARLDACPGAFLLR